MLKSGIFLFSCILYLVFSAPTSFGYDYAQNFQDLAHLDIPSGYCASWFDADSNNYFDLICWGDSGLAIVKATDPANPTYIRTATLGAAHDARVIGNYAYVSQWGWTWGDKYLMVVPLKSHYPYFENQSINRILLDDTGIDTIGTECNVIPLCGIHTLSANDQYLLMTEACSADGKGEIVILDVSSDPLHPNYAGLIDSTGIEWPFYGAHSVYMAGDTIFASKDEMAIYKLVVNRSNGFQVTQWGKIMYDSWRRDYANYHPLLRTWSDSLWVIATVIGERDVEDDTFRCTTPPCTSWVHYEAPSAHSCCLAPGGYLLSSDENNYYFLFDNQRDTVGASIRVFRTTDFNTVPDTVGIYGAFDLIWQPSEPYLRYSTDISEMDGANWPAETPCPANFDCENIQYAYMDLGAHDITVYGKLGLMAYHGLGTHIIDVSDPTNIKYRGGLAHTLANGDVKNEHAFAACMSKDGYIYTSGGYGINFYRYGLTGTISSDTTWTSDVYIFDTLTVASNHRLNLSAGTNIYMFKNALLKVNGKLVASGTSSDSVKFICLGGNPQPGDWRGIYVDQTAACSLSYCSVTNAAYGLETRTSSVVSISHSNISHNSKAGIYCYKTDLDIEYSRLAQNDIYGITGSNSAVRASHNRFVDNDDYDIYLTGDPVGSLDSVLLLYDTLATSSRFTDYGIYLYNVDKAEIYKCETLKRLQTGLTLYNSNAFVHNSIFSGGPTDMVCSKGIYADNYSYPKIRNCRMDSLIYCVKTNSSRPDMGTASDNGLSWLSTRAGIAKTYFIHHTYTAYVPDTFYAQYNWYYTTAPPPIKFYYSSPTSPVKYWPWRMSEPPVPRLSGEEEFPLLFSFRQNYPNPFNPNTTISFSLDQPGFTTVTIYNILGQRITGLVGEYLDAGEHAVIWDGRNEGGRSVSSGIYLYAIQSGDHFETKKMTLLR